MSSGDSVPFPYEPNSIHFKCTANRVFSKEGVTRPINKYAWITDGTVKQIEVGLPILYKTQFYKPVGDAEEAMKKSEKDAEALLKNLLDEQDDDEFYKEEEREREKAEERKRQQQIRERKERQKRRTTGIIPSDENEKGDILMNIGKINFRTIQNPLHKPENESPFPAKPHLKKYKPSKISTVPLIESEIRNSFKYGKPPFSGIEKEEDFPMDGFIKPESIPTPTDSPHINDIHIDDGDDLDMETPSLLIDPHGYDIYWTKTKAPFTSQEVDMLYTMRKRSDLQTQHLEDVFNNQLKQREDSIKTTFQSRSAFAKRMELIDKDIDRITNVGPGKGKAPKESEWVTASRLAPDDITSLPYRKNKWNKFVEFVAQHGYITNQSQERAAHIYRSMLMTGDPVDVNMFWKFISSLEAEDFRTTSTMLMLEYLRKDFGVTIAEVTDYLERGKINPYFYNEAVNICKNSHQKKKVKRNITIDNEHCDLATLQQKGIFDKTKIVFRQLRGTQNQSPMKSRSRLTQYRMPSKSSFYQYPY